MRVLGVETATRVQSVAVLEDECVLGTVRTEAGGSHSKWLIPAIDQVLSSCRLTLADLDAVAVSSGPGSFTGLRVGLATALAFRSVAGVPVVMVPTLEAMAWNLQGVEGPICAMLKARRGEAYWAVYRWEGRSALVQVTSERVGPVEQLLESLSQTTWVLGDGWGACKERLQGALRDRLQGVREAPGEAMVPCASSVGRASLGRLRRRETAPLGVSPLYVQRSDAELTWERTAGSPPLRGRVEGSRGSRQPGRR